MKILKPAEATAILNYMSQTQTPVSSIELRNVLGRRISAEIIDFLLGRLIVDPPTTTFLDWIKTQTNEYLRRG